MKEFQKPWWEYEPAAVIKEPGSSSKYKTGTWRTLTPVIDREKCTGCRKCWLFCPEGCVKIENGKKNIRIDYDYCKGCGICANECQFDAIKLISKISENENLAAGQNKTTKERNAGENERANRS